MRRLLLLVFISYILVGCDEGSGGVVDENSSNFSKQNKSVVIDDSNKLYRIQNAKSSSITLNIVGQKDIFVVVTSKFNNQKISILGDDLAYKDNKKSRVLSSNIISPTNHLDTVLMRKEINNILFTKKAPQLRQRVLSHLDRVTPNNNSKANFCVSMDNSYNCNNYVSASVKKVVKDIQTPYGKKSLVIWLEDGNSLSQSAIDKLSDQFLKSGNGNDIYDWVTNVVGEEWGKDAAEIDGKLIGDTDIIDILVYDMRNRGLAGYYWGKDNFKKSAIKASNEKIMFYINSELLKRDPKETYTTLTHEFQHMIHFYQRSVRKGIEDSAWYDELMSESIEDLVSTKIKYMGPRNVNPDNGTAGDIGNKGGRYPTFNKYNTVSLTTWQNTTKDYSKVSAFGTYLLRNYGGAKLLNKMMYSENQDEYAVLDATGENNFGTLIANWGSAVVLSDIINPKEKLTYNFGDFKYTSFNGIDYKLGSINFFNYTPPPTFKSSATLDKNANLYYKVGTNLSGLVTINIDIPKGADITIIAK
jgi:hypothetical protein